MIAPGSTSSSRRSSASGGFTLVELVAVLLLTAILAAAATAALTSLTSSREAAAARELFRGVTRARQRALATGVRTWIVCDDRGQTWAMLVEDPADPGRSGATVATDPATGAAMIIQLGTDDRPETGIVSVNFDRKAEVGFDWLGRPLNDSEAPLAATGRIELAGGHIVLVEPGTGHVTHVSP